MRSVLHFKWDNQSRKRSMMKKKKKQLLPLEAVSPLLVPPTHDIINKKEDKEGTEVPKQTVKKNRVAWSRQINRMQQRGLALQGFTGSANAESKVLVTACGYSLCKGSTFVKELMDAIPNSHYVHRSNVCLDEVVEYATAGNYTSVIIIDKEDMSIILLPTGPMARFKLSQVVLRNDIPEHGTPVSHKTAGLNPQIVMNDFDNKLEYLVVSIILSIFPKGRSFNSRQLVTFHNDKGLIFFRHHRYCFDKEEGLETDPQEGGEAKITGKRKGDYRKIKKANKVFCRLKECGPRFTLELEEVFRVSKEEVAWVPCSKEMK